MDVSVKDLNTSMEIKTSGIELDVYEPKTKDKKRKHLGDLFINKSKVIWCPGSTTREHGHALSWKKFIQMMEGL